MEVTLNLKICDAKLYRDTELAGKMDPYVSLNIGGQTLKTKTHDDAGKYPKWDQTFSIKTKLNTPMSFKVMDKETLGSDDLIGEGGFDLLHHYILSKKLITAPISHKNELAGEVRMEIELMADEQYHSKLRADLEADLQDKKAFWRLDKEVRKKELPKQLIYTPPLPKKGGALDEAQEKELKEELANLQKELKEVQNAREVRENDRNDMNKRMLTGTLIQEQLKKHIDSVKAQIADYKRTDIKGTFVVQILKAKLNEKCTDPIVLVGLGKKFARTKPQDEDHKNPVWNETLTLERTECDESALILWLVDEGYKNTVVGYAVLGVYSSIFSKLDERHALPLYNGTQVVGEIVFHVLFRRK